MNSRKIVEVEQVDVHCLSLSQLSSCTHVDETIIIELVEGEVLCPVKDENSSWLFHPGDLSRLIKAGRLMREFELTPVGLALVLDLLDELRALRETNA